MSTILKNKLAKEREQVEISYRSGATLTQIAEVYNVSSGTVRNVLVELGVPLRSRGRQRNIIPKDARILPIEPLPVTEPEITIEPNEHFTAQDEAVYSEYAEQIETEAVSESTEYEGGSF